MPASLFRGLKETWSRLGKTARTGVGAGAAVTLIVCIAVAVTNARGPAYETLWSNLDPADGGAIVKELEKQGIPYKLADGGKTIKVPADLVHKTRLSLASSGLPSSGVVGFESLGKTGIWATDFERKVQYVRALSGELARTIKSISGVEDARVHIVLPEDSVFAGSKKPATAAVLVKTVPGQEISSAAVKGIINLVARSVEGLSPQDVTVVDASGRLLSSDASFSDSEAISGTILELTSKAERELEKRLISLLSPVMGPGNVVCQVRAELNTDKVKILDTSYAAPEGILRSTQEITETYQGTGTPAGGQAGGLNIPSYATSGSTESRYQRTETTKNYEIGQKVTETIVVPGSIKRLSVAVIVNKQLDDVSRDMIEKTVSAALGLDPGRQDQITVIGVQFDTSLAKQISDSMSAPKETIPRIYIYAGAGALAIILVLILVMFLAGRKRSVREEKLPPLPEPRLAMEEQAPSVSPELLQRQKMKENVERIARSNPQMVATLLKSWLLEDER